MPARADWPGWFCQLTSSTLLFSTLHRRFWRLRAASKATRAMRSTSLSLYTSVLNPMRSPLSLVPKPWRTQARKTKPSILNNHGCSTATACRVQGNGSCLGTQSCSSSQGKEDFLPRAKHPQTATCSVNVRTCLAGSDICYIGQTCSKLCHNCVLCHLLHVPHACPARLLQSDSGNSTAQVTPQHHHLNYSVASAATYAAAAADAAPACCHSCCCLQ